MIFNFHHQTKQTDNYKQFPTHIPNIQNQSTTETDWTEIYTIKTYDKEYPTRPQTLSHISQNPCVLLWSLSGFITEMSTLIHLEKQGAQIALHSFRCIIFATNIPKDSFCYLPLIYA